MIFIPESAMYVNSEVKVATISLIMQRPRHTVMGLEYQNRHVSDSGSRFFANICFSVVRQQLNKQEILSQHMLHSCAARSAILTFTTLNYVNNVAAEEQMLRL